MFGDISVLHNYLHFWCCKHHEIASISYIILETMLFWTFLRVVRANQYQAMCKSKRVPLEPKSTILVSVPVSGQQYTWDESHWLSSYSSYSLPCKAFLMQHNRYKLSLIDHFTLGISRWLMKYRIYDWGMGRRGMQQEKG